MRTVSRLMISMVVVSCVSLALYWAVADRSLTTPSPTVPDTQPSIPAVAVTEKASGPEVSRTLSTAVASVAEPNSLTKSTSESSGVTPVSAAVPRDANPNVASVVEAQRTGLHPERLSIAIDPAPFDAAAFARDPQAYLNVVEPGRVYQTAPAGPDAVPLVATVDHTIRMPANGSTPLTVIGKPNAPVSFTILDGGNLPNGLASMTVQADAEGKATTTYTAVPGVVDEVQILVGSPMTVGTLTLRVEVAYPEQPALSAR